MRLIEVRLSKLNIMSKLFFANSTSSNEDYKFARDNPDARSFVENLWNCYQDHADKDFAQKIAISFHNHFWEMYLACALKENGNNLLPKKEQKGPDIVVRDDNFPLIWVEAIAVTFGNGRDKVSTLGDEKWFSVPEVRIVLRYTSAIAEKFRKYIQYRNDGVIAESEPYIIAVNGSKVPFSYDDAIPYIVQAVLPFGSPTMSFEWDDQENSRSGYDHRPQIEKFSGAPVSTRIFLEEKYRGISGIIFSRVDIHQFRTPFGNDFIFVHNPLATNKLPEGWLRVGREYRFEDDSLQYRRWPLLSNDDDM